MTIHNEALATKIRAALSMDKRTSDLPIDVRVSGGEAFLKGRVDTLEQADVMQFIVNGITGVRHVNTEELEVGG